MPRISRWMARGRIMVAIGLTALCVVPAARAEDNGVGLKPAMGWSSWSFLRHSPSETSVEAQAKAMVTSGLKGVGYQYVNLDDFWYQCPGSEGPNVDQYGRWVIDATKFPSQGSVNGIEATADYVHSLGLKFGIYVTPGISKQAVAQNTPIEGTPYTADQIATTTPENNYNCGGMVGIDYSKPGAQQFIDSWADEFASWGVDYVKLDGVGSFDIPDVEAWSTALNQTGRKIHLELSNSLAIADASTWERYSNGWRTTGDIEDYSGSVYPLTDWANVSSRFDSVAAWAPYGGPGGFNDYDSIEVGNGSGDGLTPDERQTQMSLWALGASPFILGTDLTNLTPLDRSYLLNRGVISVDQDAIDAHRIVNGSDVQVFSKTEPSGDAAAGLFDTGMSPSVITTSASALGLPKATEYLVHDLWNHTVSETGGQISEQVASHGVSLLRVKPAATGGGAAPLTALIPSGASQVPGGDTFVEKLAFTDEGVQPVQHLHLSLTGPAGWTVTPTTPLNAPTVAPGQTLTAKFTVTVPAATRPFESGTLTAAAGDAWHGRSQRSSSPTIVTVTGGPVQSPYLTYSSATDAPASFSQVGDQFGIEGAGADVYSGADDYSAIYERGVVGPTATVTTEVTGEQNLTGYAKAGIMVRNDIAGAGTAPEGVILFDSPSGGVQLEYDDNGGQWIDNVTPPNGTIPSTIPVYLKLVRTAADSYTGYWSTDGTTWQTVGTATVPDQASTQDAGMFEVSHASGVTGIATFDGFSVS